MIWRERLFFVRIHNRPRPLGLGQGQGPEASPASLAYLHGVPCVLPFCDAGTLSLLVVQMRKARPENLRLHSWCGVEPWSPAWVRSCCLHCRSGPLASELISSGCSSWTVSRTPSVDAARAAGRKALTLLALTPWSKCNHFMKWTQLKGNKKNFCSPWET